jgi:hypothetical protein
MNEDERKKFARYAGLFKQRIATTTTQEIREALSCGRVGDGARCSGRGRARFFLKSRLVSRPGDRGGATGSSSRPTLIKEGEPVFYQRVGR